MEPKTSEKSISITDLKGVNERAKFGGGELGEFDVLIGLYTPNKGLLDQVPGKAFLQIFGNGTEPILKIHQTNDSHQNIIVQTTNHVYVGSEADLFNRPIATNLVSVPLTEEEDMAQAIIIQSAIAGGAGGGGTTAGTFVQRNLDAAILSQVNADGTAAAFASVAANVITLAAGKYRIDGWCKGSDASAGIQLQSRLRISGGADLWAGLSNEYSDGVDVPVNGKDITMRFGGYIALAAPTNIILETRSSHTQPNTGMGQPKAVVGRDIYAWISILRTGA